MRERWQQIPFFRGYEISDRGRVRSARRGRARILRAQPGPGGYLCVGLRQGRRSKGRRIHRLVALAFVPRRAGCRFVNHRNGNKRDNCASNLEWVTNADNIRHAWRAGLHHRGAATRRAEA